MIDLNTLEVGEKIVDPNEALEAEWFEKRSGRITASKFDCLMQQGRGKDEKFSQAGLKYLYLKAAERLGSWHSFTSKSVEWGKEHEEDAIEWYVRRTGRNVTSCRFRFFEFNADIGGTPDGLVEDDGTLEVKVPYDPAVHVQTLVTRQIPRDYTWQPTGHVLNTERSWCDFVSYDPRITDPSARGIVIRHRPSTATIDKLLAKLQLSVKELNRIMREILQGAAR